MPEQMDIKVELERVKNFYKDSQRRGKIHALVNSHKGEGKTTLFKTCPRPIFICSFDPGGTEVLKDLIDSGDCIVDSQYEEDDLYNPTAYAAFEKNHNARGAAGFYNQFATVGIDSYTTLATCAVWQIMKKEGRVPARMDVKSSDKDQGMRIQDWGIALNNSINIARSLISLPCHTFMMGHIKRDKNDLTGEIVNMIYLPGSQKVEVPTLVPELWTLQVDKNTGERKILTQGDGKNLASTRIGAGKWDKLEKPDVKYLLKKAGYDDSDKPRLEG